MERDVEARLPRCSHDLTVENGRRFERYEIPVGLLPVIPVLSHRVHSINVVDARGRGEDDASDSFRIHCLRGGLQIQCLWGGVLKRLGCVVDIDTCSTNKLECSQLRRSVANDPRNVAAGERRCRRSVADVRPTSHGFEKNIVAKMAAAFMKNELRD
jgi:hypothetical protein